MKINDIQKLVLLMFEYHYFVNNVLLENLAIFITNIKKYSNTWNKR